MHFDLLFRCSSAAEFPSQRVQMESCSREAALGGTAEVEATGRVQAVPARDCLHNGSTALERY